jgi:hypothetical protein
MIATLVKAVVVVAIAAMVVSHAPADLRPVARTAAHAKAMVTSHVHAATARLSRAWSRLKRDKHVQRLERAGSQALQESRAALQSS